VKSEVTSKVYILHSSMLDDSILPTLGYREDRLKFYDAPGDLVSADGFSEYKAPLPTTPSSIFTQYSFNWGAVARLPRFIQSQLPLDLKPGIFYNTSDNFSPTGQRINMQGEDIAPQKGKTKEYGVMVSALGDKVSLRLTHYETSLTGVSVDMRDAIHYLVRDGISPALSFTAGGGNDTNAVAKAAFENWWSTSAQAASISKTWAFANNQPTAVLDGVMLETTDSVAKGDELELVYNPTKNWRIALNAAKNECVNANTARDALKFMNDIMPTLQGAAGQIWINQNHTTWETQAQGFVNAVNNEVYGDGQEANPELRKYHFNALTNYSFSEGALKNFGIGGAIRYADKVLIGTGWKQDPTLGTIPDYSVLYYGPSETLCDAWISYNLPNIFRHVNLALQLNVRNIGVGKKLIPTAAQPDGTQSQFRIAEPMTETLSATFEF